MEVFWFAQITALAGLYSWRPGEVGGAVGRNRGTDAALGIPGFRNLRIQRENVDSSGHT